MILGTVNARREAIVAFRVRGPMGMEVDVEAVVDSGYTGSLTLPATTVSALGLIRQSGGNAVMADGSVRQFDLYAAEVHWDGKWQPVLVSAIGTEALLGMHLLAGYQLRIDVVSGGLVQMTALP